MIDGSGLHQNTVCVCVCVCLCPVDEVSAMFFIALLFKDEITLLGYKRYLLQLILEGQSYGHDRKTYFTSPR